MPILHQGEKTQELGFHTDNLTVVMESRSPIWEPDHSDFKTKLVGHSEFWRWPWTLLHLQINLDLLLSTAYKSFWTTS